MPRERKDPSRVRLLAARRRIGELESQLADAGVEAADLERQLVEERYRAAEASRSKSLFLANMSHELRTPLNAVLGFAQLMERNPALTPQDRESLAAIVRGGEHLLALINDVLSLSRLEAGHLALVEHSYDLRRMLLGVEEVIRWRAEAQGLRLEVTLDPSLPECVRGDEDKLRQILLHLLGNAVESTEAGTVALRARWAEDLATFEVEDTGSGIAPADMGVLFEAFVQAQSGLLSSEGVGLGLALSRNLVLVMDGDIFASSEVGRGTVYTIQIPLPSDPCVHIPEARKVIGLEAGQGPFRVLVVDDGKEDRALLTGLLAAVGFEVREAENGREAVDVWTSWRPHLIWMDARMRVMDGYEATRLMRNDECRMMTDELKTEPGDDRSTSGIHQSSFITHHPTRIVALCTSAFAHEREAALANGADDFRVKPLSERDVFATVAEHLGVRYVYASNRAEFSTVATPATPERIAALPRRVVAQLSRALTIGDDRMARQIVEWIGDQDPVLAADLGLMIRQFRFDELAMLLESIPPEGR